MSVHVIVITHGEIGKALLAAATQTFGKLPLPATAVSVSSKCDPQRAMSELETLIQQLRSNDGVLVLADLYGATPCNVIQKLNVTCALKIVTGVNLPMLLRIMNYADLSLAELTEKAISGGIDGITLYQPKKEAPC